MRRYNYNILTGILLTLSIIGFALAAPVIEQEKHQARIDVVEIPKNVITVVEKRGSKLQEFWEGFLSGKLVKPPAPNPASSPIANAAPLKETFCWPGGSCFGSTINNLKVVLSSDYQMHHGPITSGSGESHNFPVMEAPRVQDPPLSSPPPKQTPDGTPPPESARPKGWWGQTSGHGPSPPLTEVDPRPQSSPDNSHPQSWSADFQQTDLQTANYAAKGKAKESGPVPGTAGDAGNMAQRELQPEPAGGSLEPELNINVER